MVRTQGCNMATHRIVKEGRWHAIDGIVFEVEAVVKEGLILLHRAALVVENCPAAANLSRRHRGALGDDRSIASELFGLYASAKAIRVGESHTEGEAGDRCRDTRMR